MVSRYTPIPEIADKAGLVWNSDTNQLAVASLKGDVTQVLSERVEAAVDERVAAVRDATLRVWRCGRKAHATAWQEQCTKRLPARCRMAGGDGVGKSTRGDPAYDRA